MTHSLFCSTPLGPISLNSLLLKPSGILISCTTTACMRKSLADFAVLVG